MAPVAISAVQPSPNFQTADLGALRIARPQNWEIVDNQQNSATIAPRAGVSGGAVAYGVVIRVARVGANTSATQITTAIAQNLQKSDSNMKVLGQVQPVTVSGSSGGSVQLETNSPMTGADGKAQREQDWLVSVQRGNSAIYFVFVSPAANFEQLRPTFEKMLASVQFR